MSMYVTNLAHFDIVLGLPWLRMHNPKVNWLDETLTFDGPDCKKHSSMFPVTVKAISKDDIRKQKEISKSRRQTTKYIEECDADSFSEVSSQGDLGVMAVSIKDIEEALRDKPKINPAEKLPKVYHDYLQVFPQEEADKLPPHRSSDHQIILQPGTEPPWGPLYGMSREELLVLRKYIEENLEKGFIRPSTSPTSSPVLFVKKPNGGLRVCVDYRALNEITVKNRYPIPRIHETLT
ncbi:hypothetical protein K3495_g14669, partial [Podosphaera aphanis]